MTRPNPRIVSILLLSALAFGLCSCGTFYSSYFQRPPDSRSMTIDSLRLTPRVFGCKDASNYTERLRRGAFAVTVRVDKGTSFGDDYDWRQKPGAVDSLAKRFFDQVTDLFVPDSIVLHETPSEAPPVVLTLDTTNFSPRREDYLTFKFGDAFIQRSTVRLRAVLHVTRPGLPPTADSVVFDMWRVELEERGLLMFTSETQGY